jgi:hypothetical protein
MGILLLEVAHSLLGRDDEFPALDSF